MTLRLATVPKRLHEPPLGSGVGLHVPVHVEVVPGEARDQHAVECDASGAVEVQGP